MGPRLTFSPVVPVVLAFWSFLGVYHRDALLIFVVSVRCLRRSFSPAPSICGCPLPACAPPQHCARGDIPKVPAPCVLRARTVSCIFSWVSGTSHSFTTPNAMAGKVTNVDKDETGEETFFLTHFLFSHFY